MDDQNIYITINHLNDYYGLSNIRVGDTLTLIKDPDNSYDDEAIAVYNADNIKIGYVANSVETVARGTFSAGRIYDHIEDNKSCIVRFLLNDAILSYID